LAGEQYVIFSHHTARKLCFTCLGYACFSGDGFNKQVLIAATPFPQIGSVAVQSFRQIIK
jgi:hypothetical protein